MWLHLRMTFDRMNPMKRVALESQMWNCDPTKFSFMKEYMDKLQAIHQDIMQVGKTISYEDMEILLISRLPSWYRAFHSFLIMSWRMLDVTWEDLVPMDLDEEN